MAEVQQAGWTCTSGAAGFSFAANSGVNVTRSFGNFHNYAISGQKFQDMNGNGIKDAGDVGLPGFHITLDGVDSALTDANGNYTINNVGPGAHAISEIQQAGYTKTTPTLNITGVSGINVAGQDLGNFMNVTIISQKFLDANFNAVKEPTEVGLNGWSIQAVNSKGQVITTAVSTDVDLNHDGIIGPTLERGIYTLSVRPGTFTIREVLKSGWVQFMPISGFYTVNVGGTFGLPSGSVVTGKNFGNAPLASHDSKSLGFWSNKNGQKILSGGDNFASTSQFLCNLNLKNVDGTDFDPLTYADLHTGLLKGTSVNAAYMLSVQMATLALSVQFNFVPDNALVYAPGLKPFASKLGGGLSPTGVISVHDLLNSANLSLAANPLTTSGNLPRSFQTLLSSVLDGCNNNKNFLT